MSNVSFQEDRMIGTFLLVSLQIAPAAVPPRSTGPESDVVVTASLTPVPSDEATASVTLFDETRIEALGLPFASDFARLTPGVSVSTTGARGTETVVRIRGAESNHTLVFVDGIAFNDIAAANAARFDALSAGGLGQIELIRGPQSALWGSEALGGVVAMSSPSPLGRFRAAALAEYGSRDSRRAEAAIASGGERAGVTATAAWQRSDGIDILGGGTGDRDGFENLTLGAKGVVRLGAVEIGGAGRYIDHDIAFDGFDPATFARADTADRSAIETHALRGWIGFGEEAETGWNGRLEVQHLDSGNRNRIGATRTTDTSGRRIRYGGRIGYRFALGPARHGLTAALEREEEDFSTRDRQFGGASDRDLSRGRTALVGEWRAEWNERLVTDLAVRHDDFNRFVDDTTWRAAAMFELGGGFALLGGYGEGIAQPSFVDLFGFPGFPFVGNPDLRPERSRGFEGGARWRGSGLLVEAVVFSNDLEDEIVEDFSAFPSSVVNSAGTSRRRGLELSGEWRPSEALSVGANYTYLDSREEEVGGTRQREIRRPRHAANAFLDWHSGPVTLGGSLAYVGRRLDRDFDLFPAPVVALDEYLLASLRVAYRIGDRFELYARGENLFDADYRDVVGYHAPGRTLHAGLRVTFGD
jgi:vitamin B12 transporter